MFSKIVFRWFWSHRSFHLLFWWCILSAFGVRGSGCADVGRYYRDRPPPAGQERHGEDQERPRLEPAGRGDQLRRPADRYRALRGLTERPQLRPGNGTVFDIFHSKI